MKTESDLDDEISRILRLDEERMREISRPFNPVTGLGSLGERVRVDIPDFCIPSQWLPADMLSVPLLRRILDAGSIARFAGILFPSEDPDIAAAKISRQLVRLRCRFDFPFWAASFVRIKRKGGGDDVLFRLTRPQRRLVSIFEERRRAGKPIRLVLLKARQWGGSTTTQIYMAWLQLFHRKGLNSLIIAHQGAGSDEIKDMFDRMIDSYPLELLYPPGIPFDPSQPKMTGVGKSGSIHRIPARNCKIKIGTAERPDSCRGGDYNLVHLSEVGIWKKTDGKSPEDIVRSACSGILYAPLTMIVLESTANGTGNFFHTEYSAAAGPSVPSQFQALFIAWFDIDQYSLPFSSPEERYEFARLLYVHRQNDSVLSSREESGKYLWWLWTKGATLEAIHWYVSERSGKNDHAVMASEYPTDDVEAFVHSGTMVFDRYLVEELASCCRPPRMAGEIVADAAEGPDALRGLHFVPDSQGKLAIWTPPESDDDYEISDRYLTVVDVGGRSDKADWSVVTVFDRSPMMDGDRPSVVAQWYGHTDIDRLAWKAAQIAAFYGDSLLVIESNTLETHDRERQVEGGDQSLYILSQIADLYPNLYARRQSEDEIRQGLPRKYGFHTNVSTKPMVVSTLVRAVRDHLYTERDRRALDEMLVYERKPNGAYGAIAGRHDDLLMTRAIGLHICFHEMPLPRLVDRSRPRHRKSGLVSEAAW